MHACMQTHPFVLSLCFLCSQSVYAANKLEELLKHEKKMDNLNACMPFCPSRGKKGCFVANELEELLKPEKEMGNLSTCMSLVLAMIENLFCCR